MTQATARIARSRFIIDMCPPYRGVVVLLPAGLTNFWSPENLDAPLSLPDYKSGQMQVTWLAPNLAIQNLHPK